jgi:agmatine deiminase
MITDRDTNYVFFSSLIKERTELKTFWRYLEKTLKKACINYSFIDGTSDLWCRDYMPVQIAKDEYVQFVFDPSYYKTKKYKHLLTDTQKVKYNAACGMAIQNSPILLDGGNLVRSRNTVVLTERAVKENKTTKEELLPKLKQVLKVENVHFIPAQPNETSGHSDGMVRLLDDHTLLVADYQQEQLYWKTKYERALKNTGLQLIPFPGVTTEIKNNKGEYTAIGCYINFAWIGNTILFPQFNIAEDKEALREAKQIFKDCSILPVPTAELAMFCGVLNCATWNINI